MRRLAIIIGLCLGLIWPAQAQTARKLLLPNGGAPAWVLRAGGVVANVDLNFATGQYYGCSLASCLSITRASSKTNLLPLSASGFAYTTVGNNVLAIDSNGLLIEEARTNQLLNSTAPATQTTGSLANGTYTLWVNGSGSAQMSLGTGVGCGVGTATNGTPVNFTISTPGTCIVTVIGSLNAFQLELGAFGTSLIVTTGATATRAADSIPSTGSLLTALTGTSVSVVFKIPPMEDAGTERVFVAAGGGSARFERNFTNQTVIFNAAASALQAVATPPWTSATNKVGAAWNASGRSLVANNSGLVTDATTNTLTGSPMLGQQSGGTKILSGYIARLSVWTSRLPDAALSGATQ